MANSLSNLWEQIRGNAKFAIIQQIGLLVLGSAAMTSIIHWWQTMPWDVAVSFGVLTGLLIFFLYKLIESTRPLRLPSPKEVSTRLRIQFGASGVYPLAISQENIWHWNALQYNFNGINPTGKSEVLGRCTTLVMVFNNPVPIKQLGIDTGSVVLPFYEVKRFDQRHIIITFSGELTNLVLTVKAIFD